MLSIFVSKFSNFGLVTIIVCRYLDYGRLGIKTYTLSQHKEALEDLKKGVIAKAIFKIQ